MHLELKLLPKMDTRKRLSLGDALSCLPQVRAHLMKLAGACLVKYSDMPQAPYVRARHFLQLRPILEEVPGYV